MIQIKTPEEIAAMRPCGRLSARVLRKVGELVRPGVSTYELDRFAYDLINLEGGTPAFLGYNGYPASICTSINDQIVHGIPSPDVVLYEGDIVSIDVGAVVDGWVGDNAATFAVGEVSAELRQLIEVTEASMWEGIGQAMANAHVGDISFAVQSYAESYGYGVVYEYTGHGIGRKMHEEPNIPNFGRRGEGPLLREGMVIAIEPMINLGTADTRGPYADKWTVFTADRKPSAHFEKTVAITAEGPVVITEE
ncbi:MAG: type I methionyl aminopeptidase [Coriobacteriia bacterium]|nr:type I methionyl aminopeptidase [Coriobacteriia bacterium]